MHQDIFTPQVVDGLARIEFIDELEELFPLTLKVGDVALFRIELRFERFTKPDGELGMAAKAFDDMIERIEVWISIDEDLMDKTYEIADEVPFVARSYFRLYESGSHRIVDLEEFR